MAQKDDLQKKGFFMTRFHGGEGSGRPFGRRRRGFLLIELMIAMFVFTVAFLALLGTFPSSIASVNQARDEVYMTHIARQQLEYVLSKPFTTASLSTSGVVSKVATVNNVVTVTNYNYALTVTPDTTGGLEAASKKTAVVTVYESTRPYQYTKMETHVARSQ